MIFKTEVFEKSSFLYELEVYLWEGLSYVIFLSLNTIIFIQHLFMNYATGSLNYV
jgi:hypothetical protein